MASTFSSLAMPDFRRWFICGVISNIGTWMQRTAQDWLVLTGLTDHNATALGIVIALQFGPMLLLLPFTGVAADRFDKRKLLMMTQLAMTFSTLLLGLLTLSGHIQLWQVYGFALASGCIAAFDAPARQAFVPELVSDGHLSNAVALSSLSFNAARMVGPALSGLLIPIVGIGWVFMVNVLTFLVMMWPLIAVRHSQLNRNERPTRAQGGLIDGFRYVWARPHLKALLLMLFVTGTFGMNYPIHISTMTVTVFAGDSSRYGLLMSMMAVGSVIGAVLCARRGKPGPLLVGAAAGVFGLSYALAAAMSNVWMFGLMLTLLGLAAQTFVTSSNSMVLMSTDPNMRGRVMAILLATTLGGAPAGAPIVGWVADVLGPRWALGIAAASGLIATLVWLKYLIRHRGLQVRFASGRLAISVGDGD
jgi:MFS family permease